MKRRIKNEIEYRLGLYFSLKSGAMYVRDKKYGDNITKDVIFLSRKQLGKIPEERDFKSICVWYRTKLM